MQEKVKPDYISGTIPTKETYAAFAKKCEVDTHGDIFAESGWGISFAFDLAYALWAWGQKLCEDENVSDKICDVLAVPNIQFRPGLGEYEANVLDETNLEYYTAQIVVAYLKEDSTAWMVCADHLAWFQSREKDNEKTHG